MTEEQLIKRVDSLLCVAIISIAVAGTHLPYFKEPEQIEEEKEPVTPEIVLIPQVYEKRQPNKAVLKEMELRNLWQSVDVTYTTLETEYLGRYFVTAYCPAECGGSWTTASGATCHRADDGNRLESPTTCAVDPKIHSIWGGTYFYIEEFDRIFVAEDTGSAVKNYHLDLFYEEMSDVQAFPTGYYTVYTVEYIKKTAIVTEEADEAFQTMSPTDYYRDITYE